MTPTAAYVYQFDNTHEKVNVGNALNELGLGTNKDFLKNVYVQEKEDKEFLKKLEKFVTCVKDLATPNPIIDMDKFNVNAYERKKIVQESVTYFKNLLKDPSFPSCLDILPSNSTNVASLSTYCAILMMILFCVRLCLT